MAFERDDPDHATAVSRRGFLTGLGAGAAGAAGAVVLPTDAAAIETRPTTRPDRFSRLFPNLRPFVEAKSSVLRALSNLGAPGGIMDAKDPLNEGPIRLITNPELSPGNLDNAANTAGTTFFGQFLDHDMTFDTTSRLGVPTPPERSLNTRTPVFDLDTVYGGGPTVSPHLYETRDERAKFKTSDGGRFEDLVRNHEGTAIIPDPRNDENMMISGLQIAFMLFHNQVVDMLRDRDAHRRSAERGDFSIADGRDGDRDSRDRTFEEARQIVIWHYQWIIVNEFLPQIIGANVVNDILRNGRRFYTPRPGEQSIPVEFQLMYRFGHSLIRPSYRANLLGDFDRKLKAPAPFFGFIFDPAIRNPGNDPADLRGGARAPRRFIGWQTFFRFDGALATDVRPNKLIDTTISTPLFHLPLAAIASGDRPQSLPERNLLRHVTWSVPSGQDVAEAMRIPALSSSNFQDLKDFGVGLERSTPLWFYILREAELLNAGARLTGIGARIIGEVFLGLLQLDRNSYFNASTRDRRGWRPTLPSRTRGTFGMVDLVTFAGVNPTSRDQ